MLRTEIMHQRLKLYTLAGIIGIVSGLVAVLFRWLILSITLIFFLLPQVFGLWGWLLIPTIGGLIVGVIVMKYAPEAKGHGVPEVMVSYSIQGGKMRVRVPILKALASAFSIGSGGSCGREGPIAQIGAGVGSSIAALMNLDKKQTKTLLVCGVSSGISATFNAPLGGTLFGIEVIAGGIVGFSIVPVILSSVIATAITYTILGTELSFQAPAFTLSNPLELVFYLGLGLLLGLISIIWIHGFYFIEDIFERIPTSKYLLPALGGFATGALLLLTIYLEGFFSYSGVFNPGDPYYPAIAGIGYALTDAALIGTVSLGALLAFSLLKALATAFTLGSGGSGGIFAPTLTIGSTLGGAFGLVMAILFPALIRQPTAYALVGMAALFAGTARAPITCIVILMEMTSDYAMILPLMIAVSASFLISSVLDEKSIYTMKLSRRGIHIKQGLHISALKEIEVSEIMTREPTVLSLHMTQDDVLKIITSTQHTKYPVVDDEGHVVGTLIAEELFQKDDTETHTRQVKDLMNKDFLHLTPDCKMDSVLHTMIERWEGHAVVVDSQQPDIMIGFVTKADVLRAYELAIFRLQQQGVDIEEISPIDFIDIT